MTDRIYPQFATHNAHTVAAMLEMAGGQGRLSSSSACMAWASGCMTSCMRRRGRAAGSMRRSARIAICWPIWCGACWRTARTVPSSTRSSMRMCRPHVVAACPFEAIAPLLPAPANPAIRRGPDLFGARGNSRGWDLTGAGDLAAIEAARAPCHREVFHAAPHAGRAGCGPAAGAAAQPRRSGRPGGDGDQCGAGGCRGGASLGRGSGMCAPAERAAVLRRAAALYEAEFAPVFALLAREAGKTPCRCDRRVARGGGFPALLCRGAQRRWPRRRAGHSSASARGISRWRSSPGRSRRRWRRAMR